MSAMETLQDRCLQLYLAVLTSGIDKKKYKSYFLVLDYLVVNTTGYSL